MKKKNTNGSSVLDVIGRQTSDMFLKHCFLGVFFFLSELRPLPKILLLPLEFFKINVEGEATGSF